MAGSLAYMAPEQAGGVRRDLTARCDVYSLGVILFELLTGRTPFRGADDIDLRAWLATEETPRPRALRPGLPHDVEAIVLRCLERDPARRYAGATALADDLRRFLAGKPTHARPVGTAGRLARWVRRRPLLAGLASAVSLALAAVLVLAGYLVQAQALAEEREFHGLLSRAQHRRASRPAGWVGDNLRDLRALAAMSPAKDHLVALRTEAADALAAVELRPPRPLQEGFNAGRVAFSPDGKVAALGEHWPPDNGPLRVRLHDVESGTLLRELPYPVDDHWETVRHKGKWADGPKAMTFSPDGRWLVVGTKSGWLVVWDLRDAKPEPVRRWRAHPWEDGEFGIEAAHFMEDGTVLATSTKTVIRCWSSRDWRPVGQPAEGRLPDSAPPLPPAARLLWEKEARCWFDFHLDEWGLCPPAGMKLPKGYSLSDHGLGVTEDEPHSWLVLMTRGERRYRLAQSVRGRNSARPLSQVFVSGSPWLIETLYHSNQLRLWDVAGRQLLHERQGVPGQLHVAAHPDGRRVAVTEGTRTHLYEVASSGVRRAVAVQPRIVRSFDVTPDDLTILTCPEADDPILWLRHRD